MGRVLLYGPGTALWPGMAGYGRVWIYGRVWPGMAGYGRVWRYSPVYGGIAQSTAVLPLGDQGEMRIRVNVYNGPSVHTTPRRPRYRPYMLSAVVSGAQRR